METLQQLKQQLTRETERMLQCRLEARHDSMRYDKLAAKGLRDEDGSQMFAETLAESVRVHSQLAREAQMAVSGIRSKMMPMQGGSEAITAAEREAQRNFQSRVTNQSKLNDIA